MKLVQIISEVCAPWCSNLVMFLALGFALDANAAGIGAAFMTGIMPMIGLLWMKSWGKVTDHHVTKAAQRTKVFAMIAGFLALLCLYLILVPTPRDIWVAFVAAVAFIVIYAFITKVVGIKLSVHVGLWVCVYGFLAVTISPWWTVGLLATPAVWWARVKLGHHTNKEAAVGLLVGLVLLGVASKSI
ncbi:phosphoesterase [Corynebacterium callunae]|uniref:phosphoesterase n=1 Tax=Corynebacterium callunae TaxID=1721 RepID=UPI0039828FD2